MGFTDFLAERYGVGMVFDALKASYPPALVFIEKLGDSSLPEAVAAWLPAHKTYIASLPASPAVNWDGYSQRFLTAKPALYVLTDLFKDLGMADLFGIDIDEFLKALASYRSAGGDSARRQPGPGGSPV
jgi:hypothetical protein